MQYFKMYIGDEKKILKTIRTGNSGNFNIRLTGIKFAAEHAAQAQD
jgi:hypothetical protein